MREATRPVPAEDADTPVRWLLAHGLLVGIDSDTVELPREIGLLVRGDEPLGPPRLRPPDATPREVGRTPRTLPAPARCSPCCGWSRRCWRRTALEPPVELRSGGLGVRELRRTAKVVDADEPTAAALLETARAAGLLESAATRSRSGCRPSGTTGGSAWTRRCAGSGWRRAWLAMTRLPALVGQRDDRGRALAPLSMEVERTSAPGTRRRVLSVLADLPPGTALDAAAIADQLAWRSPRRSGQRADLVEGILREAELLGLTGRGALTSYGRALLAGGSEAGRGDRAGRAAAAAGGPRAGAGRPDRRRARAAGARAGPGDGAGRRRRVGRGRTVYRVTEATVRRALDAGRSAADLHELFRPGPGRRCRRR